MVVAASTKPACHVTLCRPCLPPQFAIWQLANPNVYLQPEINPAGSFYYPQNHKVRWLLAGFTPV